MTTESVVNPNPARATEAVTAPQDAGQPGQGSEPEAIEQHQPPLEELAADLAVARARADETWDQLLRARAETENLRRRQAAELEKAHKYALDSFVRELLQVQDSLELGLGASLEAGADIEKLREGSALTLKLLGDTMAKFGVEAVAPEGLPFNPELHQAMSMEPRADLPANTVTRVMQKGYTLNGRLVRPALVMVSRAP
jgi:molecular chaperone GrpE